MPTKLGFTKFNSGKIVFSIGNTGEKRHQVQADLQDLEDLTPLCTAINAISDKTKITAELQNITGSDGKTVYKTCILSSDANSVLVNFPKNTPANFKCMLFQPGILRCFNASSLDNALFEITNSDTGLKIEMKSFEVTLHPRSPRSNSIFGSSSASASSQPAAAQSSSAPQLK